MPPVKNKEEDKHEVICQWSPTMLTKRSLHSLGCSLLKEDRSTWHSLRRMWRTSFSLRGMEEHDDTLINWLFRDTDVALLKERRRKLWNE